MQKKYDRKQQIMSSSKTNTLSLLEQTLEYEFKDLSLLKLALTHGSFFHERKQTGASNETLEFLGDAILDFVISDILFEMFPEKREGDLSKMRAAIVNEKTLEKIAHSINLGQFLYLGVGEEKGGGREKPSILADTLEALIAAIYQDGGVGAVRTFVKKLFKDALRDVENSFNSFDYKSTLQQYFQAIHRRVPRYCVIKESGPDHDKVFQVKIMFGERELANGSGHSKKEAEQDAARQALRVLEV